jgi:hypothetical protein
MNCTKCNIENIEGAQFCKNCGAKLNQTQIFEEKNSNKVITLFVAVISSFILVELFYFAGTKFDFEYVYEITDIPTLMTFIPTITLLIAALLMPNQKAKIALFIAFAIMFTFLVGYYPM